MWWLSWIVWKSTQKTVGVLKLKFYSCLHDFTISFWDSAFLLAWKLVSFPTFILFYLGFLSGTFTIHRIAGEEAVYLTPLYHIYPLHRYLVINQAITAESPPLDIFRSRIRTGNFRKSLTTKLRALDDEKEKNISTNLIEDLSYFTPAILYCHTPRVWNNKGL